MGQACCLGFYDALVYSDMRYWVQTQLCCGVWDGMVYHDAISENTITWQALGLKSRDVMRLFKVFQQIDADGSGEVDIVEFLNYFRLKRTKFSKRAFLLMDEDGSGALDFREFVVATYNYCTVSADALTLFAFDLYDDDASGFIDGEEMTRMVKDIWGNGYKHSIYSLKILDLLARKIDVQISHEAFDRFAKKHPAMLFPAFQMQKTLQRRIVGLGFWHRLGRNQQKTRAQEGWKDLYRALKNLDEQAVVEDLEREIEKAQLQAEQVIEQGRVSSVAAHDLVGSTFSRKAQRKRAVRGTLAQRRYRNRVAVDQRVANANAIRVSDDAWNARVDKVSKRETKNDDMMDRLVDRMDARAQSGLAPDGADRAVLRRLEAEAASQPTESYGGGDGYLDDELSPYEMDYEEGDDGSLMSY